MKIINKIVLSATLALLPVMSQAADIGTRVKDINDDVSAITVLLILASVLLGVLFMILGGVNLKKYADNPQQNPISKPIIFLLAGIILFGLGSTSQTLKDTLFGEDAENTNYNINNQIT